MGASCNSTRRKSALIAAAVLSLAVSSAHSADITWANTGISWNAGANWVGGVVPANSTTADVAIFEGTPAFQPFLNTARSIGALDLRSSGWEFSGSRITLGSGIPMGMEGINSTTNAAGVATFQNGLIISSSHVWNCSLNVTCNGSIDFNSTSGSRTLTVNSPALTTFAGGVVLISNSTVFTRTIALAGSGNLSIPSEISNMSTGTANLAINSTGTVSLLGLNTYNGNTILNSGTVVINSDASFGAAPVAFVAAAIDVTGNSNLRLSVPISLNSNRGLQIADDMTLALHGPGKALGFGSLSLGTSASLDVNDNDLVVTGTPRAAIESSIVAARHGGAWDAAGITSSAAKNDAAHLTTLGTLRGSEYTSVGGTGNFNGLSYASSDTLVKYTWYGDTDFNGLVEFDDYVRTDAGFNLDRTGWLNGDFDFSGSVEFDDYVLIDAAYNGQNGTLIDATNWIAGDDRSAGNNSAGVAFVREHFERFGMDYANAFLAQVPEPTGMAIIGLLSAPILRRRSAKIRS